MELRAQKARPQAGTLTPSTPIDRQPQTSIYIYMYIKAGKRGPLSRACGPSILSRACGLAILLRNTPKSAHSTHLKRTLDANWSAHSMPPPHPCPNHNKVRVPRAYGHQSMHAQAIIPFLFQEHTHPNVQQTHVNTGLRSILF